MAEDKAPEGEEESEKGKKEEEEKKKNKHNNTVLSSNAAVLVQLKEMLERSGPQEWCQPQGLWKARSFPGNSEEPPQREPLKAAGLENKKLLLLEEKTCPTRMLEDLFSNLCI